MKKRYNRAHGSAQPKPRGAVQTQDNLHERRRRIYRQSNEEVFTHETLKFLYDIEAVVMDLEQKGGTPLICFAHSVCGD